VGFDKAQARTIVSDACSLLLWRPAGASDHLVALLGEMYSETWNSTEGLDGVVSFDSGSMAGTALADLIFAVAMSKVLRVFHDRMLDAGLVPTVPCSVPQSIFGGSTPTAADFQFQEVSFVDDVAVPLLAPAASLIESVSSAAFIAREVFATFGLQLVLYRQRLQNYCTRSMFLRVTCLPCLLASRHSLFFLSEFVL
jgi:hypothetical protein